jgi:hypothetical protein
MFREISLNEIEMVAGGNRYASSCDDDSGYFWKEMSSAAWDDACKQMAKDVLEALKDRYPGINASLDGNTLVWEGWKVPVGYKWAPDPNGEGGISDKYLIAPDGKLVISPEYSKQICDNAFALKESRGELTNFMGALNAAMPLTGNASAVVGISGFDLFVQAYNWLNHLAGDMPSFCVESDGSVDSNYVLR